ncbi:rRNA maturation RNase YbeY [Spiroplasma sp. AdecLV25b]|uniref:rRNA maturation RNase YbeY n=1 Tax=Spiroplasma sp. AdecLV25b TaxID=3027162 RepID=UPI0027DFF298|nr:rRNA maturation RNase YbeY [Spiroplasma sp. AdecLV25b]
MVTKNLNIVNVYNEHCYDINTFNVFSQKILQTLASKLNAKKPWMIAVIFSDETTSQQLNIDYRQKDYVPDVLSFGNEDDNFPTEDNEIRDLGDVYICYAKAVNQAQTYVHSLIRELCFLFLHGLLHTLGYDHQTVEEETIMFGLQDEILNQLNITRN